MILSDLTEIKIGYQFRDSLSNYQSEFGDIQVITQNQLDYKNLKIHLEQCPRIDFDKSFESNILEKGAILFVAKGNHNIALRPEPAGLKLLPSSNFLVLYPKQEILSSDFLFTWLNSKIAQKQITNIRRVGSTIPTITLKDFQQLELNLPSMETQRLISSYYLNGLQEGEILAQLQQKKTQFTELFISRKLQEIGSR